MLVLYFSNKNNQDLLFQHIFNFTEINSPIHCDVKNKTFKQNSFAYNVLLIVDGFTVCIAWQTSAIIYAVPILGHCLHNRRLKHTANHPTKL